MVCDSRLGGEAQVADEVELPLAPFLGDAGPQFSSFYENPNEKLNENPNENPIENPGPQFRSSKKAIENPNEKTDRKSVQLRGATAALDKFSIGFSISFLKILNWGPADLCMEKYIKRISNFEVHTCVLLKI